MAIYSLPNEQPRQRGSKKGNTFTRTANGFIIRKRFMPTIVRNVRTTRQRAKFNTASTGYRTASASQKGNFDHQASLTPMTNSLGETYYLTGQQRYNSQNQNRLLNEATVSNVAFSNTVFPEIAIVGGGANVSPPSLQIVVDPSIIPVGFDLIISATPLGYYTFPTEAPSTIRIIKKLPQGATGTINLWADLTQVFGTRNPVAGISVIIGIRLYHRNSGQKGNYTFAVLGFI